LAPADLGTAASVDGDVTLHNPTRVAMAHWWEADRIFILLNLTAYLDESGTHDASPVTVMAGIMATALQWRHFESEFARLKAKYGFKVFHTKKFKKSTGDFRGWHPLRKFVLMQELAKITSSENAFIESVTVTLDNADYKMSYIGGDKPRRLRLESKYGLCFRNCLIFFLLEAVKFAKEPPAKLHFALESGHRNCNEVRDIFNEMREEVRSLGVDILGEIIFADKADCDPLMMADFLAHTAFMIGRSGETAPNEVPFLERAKESSLPPGQSGVTHLRFGPGGLADLKNVLIEKLRAKSVPGKPLASEGQAS
jgi:Protein of unknown function (DUF3800)